MRNSFLQSMSLFFAAFLITACDNAEGINFGANAGGLEQLAVEDKEQASGGERSGFSDADAIGVRPESSQSEDSASETGEESVSEPGEDLLTGSEDDAVEDISEASEASEQENSPVDTALDSSSLDESSSDQSDRDDELVEEEVDDVFQGGFGDAFAGAEAESDQDQGFGFTPAPGAEEELDEEDAEEVLGENETDMSSSGGGDELAMMDAEDSVDNGDMGQDGEQASDEGDDQNLEESDAIVGSEQEGEGDIDPILEPQNPLSELARLFQNLLTQGPIQVDARGEVQLTSQVLGLSDNGADQALIRYRLLGSGVSTGLIDGDTYRAPTTYSEIEALIEVSAEVDGQILSANLTIQVAPLQDGLVISSNSLIVRPGETAELQVQTLSGQPVDLSDVDITVDNPSSSFQVTLEGSQLSGPDFVDGEQIIVVEAALKSDPSVNGRVELAFVPGDRFFAGCFSADLPVVARFYQLPPKTKRLPDFSQMNSQGNLCLEQFDVPKRGFESGFPGVPGLFEWFAISAHSQIMIPEDGEYTFRLLSDDGAKLYIDGQLVVDNDGVHAPRSRSKKVTLSSGLKTLRLDYFQGPRFLIALQLFWKKPGQNGDQIIEKSAFRPPLVDQVPPEPFMNSGL